MYSSCASQLLLSRFLGSTTSSDPRRHHRHCRATMMLLTIRRHTARARAAYCTCIPTIAGLSSSSSPNIYRKFRIFIATASIICKKVGNLESKSHHRHHRPIAAVSRGGPTLKLLANSAAPLLPLSTNIIYWTTWICIWLGSAMLKMICLEFTLTDWESFSPILIYMSKEPLRFFPFSK